MPAQLQDANVRRDAPTVRRRDARSVAVHISEAIGHHLKKMADGRVQQMRTVVRRRLLKSAQHNHSVTLPVVAMARRTINVEALLPARQIRSGNGEGKYVRRRPVDCSLIHQLVRTQFAARNRPGNLRALRASIAEKSSRLIRQIFWLDVHIQSATACEHSHGERGKREHPNPRSRYACALPRPVFECAFTFQFHTLHASQALPEIAAFRPNRNASRAPSRTERIYSAKPARIPAR